VTVAITDERYHLGVKPGDRMRLRGKKVKPKGPDKKLVWETREVNRDYGLCQP